MEEEEEEEEESYSGANAVNEEDPERDRATGSFRDIETTFFDPASVFLSTH